MAFAESSEQGRALGVRISVVYPKTTFTPGHLVNVWRRSRPQKHDNFDGTTSRPHQSSHTLRNTL